MSRKVPSGTPDRSPEYIVPHDRGRPLVLVTIATALVAVVILGLYVVGLRRFASPGPVAQSHAPVEFRCAQCHDVGRGVADLRCERCHDSRGADRFTQPAHVLFGSGNSRKATEASPVACAVCHADHRGRRAPLKIVNDRECAQCHAFSSLKSHPEFAAVSAQFETGTGMATFTHQRHLDETVKQLGKRCAACHVQTPDGAAFQPISFDRHCATCHLKNGVFTATTEEIAGQYLMMDDRVAGAPAPGKTDAGRGQFTFTNMRHRDPWVLYNAERLRRVIDPGGVDAEATALNLQIAYLSQQVEAQPLSQIDAADLRNWQSTLEQDVASIDARLVTKPTTDDAALAEIRGALQQLRKQLTGVDPQVAAAFDLEPSGANPQRPPETAAQMQQAYTARKAELKTLLDAIAARGNKALADRAAALKKRVDQLQPAPNGQADVEGLNERLRSLDEVLGAVRATADAQASANASQIAVLRDVVQGRVNGGLAPAEFERRRLEMFGILDAIERGGGPAFGGRVDVLRQRVQALQPGSYGDAGLRDLRARKAKLLGRVKLELTLRGGGQDTAGPAALPPSRDRQALQAMLDSTRARLATLQTGGWPGAAETPDEIQDNTQALMDVLGGCRKCHAMDGARIARMKPSGVVFQRARFTHKPHVEQGGTCESCHGSVDKSKQATDLNEPGVVKCRECHTPSKSRADCAACHYYHPPSVTRLFGTI